MLHMIYMFICILYITYYYICIHIYMYVHIYIYIYITSRLVARDKMFYLSINTISFSMATLERRQAGAY